MKQITIISLLAALIFGACGGEQPSKEERNIKSLKKELAEKKTALKTLKQEIAALEEQLETLEPSKSMARTLVTVNTFPKKNFATYIEVQATVQSDDAYKISSEVGGRLIRFSLKEGSVVTKGQLIGEVDMEGVSKQLDELETALDLARTAYENQKRLWEQKIGSEIQYLQAKNQKERLEKSIETIRFQTTKSKISLLLRAKFR
jgi:multidrug efflux pump subunit AcrA (membrane-fusion protein)